MAHGPSRIESALRGRFALVRTGEGILVSRRVGLVSPWALLPLLPGRSINALIATSCALRLMFACLPLILTVFARKIALV